MQTSITVVHYELHDVAAYINWIYFFHAWGFTPKYAEIARIHDCDACRASWIAHFPEPERDRASEALLLYQEANQLINQLDGHYQVHATYKLMNANSDGDDLLLDGKRVPFLRQQTCSAPTDSDQNSRPEPTADHATNTPVYLCLTDFVRPLDSGISDTVGAFATTVDPAMEQLYAEDDYQHLLVNTLCERLAEAAAEKLHETIRKITWGYAKEENLSIQDLLLGGYQGIRPATGYPSLPDLSINFMLNELIAMDHIGIRLTENGMMQPAASVCGFIFAHPAARYFSVGKIDQEQVADYARRRGMDIPTVKKFLRSNLKD